jgi:hypothetical protein
MLFVCAISKTCDWSDAQNVIGYNNNNHYNGGEVNNNNNIFPI